MQRTIGGGLFVSGTAKIEARHSCHRCLTEWTEATDVPISAMFSSRSAEDDEQTFPLSDVIDLEAPIRDDVLLAMPISPTCPDGCDPQLVGSQENGLNTAAPAEPSSADGAQDVSDVDEGSPFSVLRDLLEPPGD